MHSLATLVGSVIAFLADDTPCPVSCFFNALCLGSLSRFYLLLNLLNRWLLVLQSCFRPGYKLFLAFSSAHLPSLALRPLISLSEGLLRLVRRYSYGHGFLMVTLPLCLLRVMLVSLGKYHWELILLFTHTCPPPVVLFKQSVRQGTVYEVKSKIFS